MALRIWIVRIVMEPHRQALATCFVRGKLPEQSVTREVKWGFREPKKKGRPVSLDTAIIHKDSSSDEAQSGWPSRRGNLLFACLLRCLYTRRK